MWVYQRVSDLNNQSFMVNTIPCSNTIITYKNPPSIVAMILSPGLFAGASSLVFVHSASGKQKGLTWFRRFLQWSAVPEISKLLFASFESPWSMGISTYKLCNNHASTMQVCSPYHYPVTLSSQDDPLGRGGTFLFHNPSITLAVLFLYVYIYIYTHTYIYIHIYIYTYVLLAYLI